MKRETLEEAVKSYCEKEYSTPKPLGICIDFAKLGANWQAERMYSEEDLKNAFFSGCQSERQIKPRIKCWEEWFEQFKKK